MMMKLASAAVVGCALAVLGCHAQTRPAAPASSGGAMMEPPAPPPPYAGGPEVMAHQECPGCPWTHHEGREARGHHEDGDDDEGDDKRMARHGHRGGRHGWGHRGPGGGGQEVLRELAALGVHFYPPKMLLRRAEKIGLAPDQVTKIRQETLGTQAHAVDLLAKIEHAKIEVARLLSAEKIDEHAIDAQIDEAAKAQAEMHKLHLGAMLRVRVLLTPEQRQKLEERKHKHESPKPGVSGAGQTSGPVEPDDDDDDDDDAAEG
jgi:Spy/CpxP family protein refolding chaperone